MIKNELARVTYELTNTGYAVTSYDQLGIPFDADLAAQAAAAAAGGGFSESAAKVTEHIGKENMSMVQDDAATALGKRLIQPAIETVFPGSPWSFYAMNHYDADGVLGPHEDGNGSSVMIVTAAGERQFDIYEKGRPENDERITRSFTLRLGHIMILDAQADPRHGVVSQGPGASAVADIHDMLRPSYRQPDDL